MIICFTLSMPNRGSWNGRWSGEERLYQKTVNLGRTQKATAKGLKIISEQSYYYGWSDGWGASVGVKEVNAKESAMIKRKTAGFCGYDWMIRSIMDRGRILADHEIKKESATPPSQNPAPTTGKEDVK